MNESMADLFQIFGRATPAIFAFVPTLIAIIMFVVSKRTGKTGLKWGAFVPLVIGIILGIIGYQLLSDSLFVQLNLLGSRSEMLYRAIPIIPALAGIVIFVLDRLAGREISSNL